MALNSRMCIWPIWAKMTLKLEKLEESAAQKSHSPQNPPQNLIVHLLKKSLLSCEVGKSLKRHHIPQRFGKKWTKNQPEKQVILEYLETDGL